MVPLAPMSVHTQHSAIKTAINSGHYVLPAMPKGSACTLLRPLIGYSAEKMKMKPKP